MNDGSRQTSVDDVGRLIRQVLVLRASQGSSRLARIAELFQRARSIVGTLAEQRRANSSRFNVFDALGLCDSELAHSGFLAFLLDPHAHHDQGAIFLDSFLARFAGASGAVIPDTRGASIFTEYTLAGDRLDIVIFLPHFGVVCIENKTWSSEGERQVARYQEWLATQAGAKRLVFLTPDGRAARSAEGNTIPVTPVSYHALAEWLRTHDFVTQHNLRTALDMYAESCLKLHAQSLRKGEARGRR